MRDLEGSVPFILALLTFGKNRTTGRPSTADSADSNISHMLGICSARFESSGNPIPHPHVIVCVWKRYHARYCMYDV